MTGSKEKLKWLLLAVFAAATFILLFQREPFFDEAHAWMVSKSFSFLDIFRIEKFEGHLFIWHTLIMPFAKGDIFYPYSIYILNWFFCVTAVCIFLFKAPFSNVEKGLVIFSFPFFWYFAQVARCYSIGILFLFLILSLWKDRLKKPVLFSFLIVLLANTSVMALIGAFSIGLIFLFDLIKEKKINPLPYLIMMMGVILVLIQLFGAHHPDAAELSGQKLFFYNVAIYFFLLDFKNILNPWYILNKAGAYFVLALYLTSVFYFYKSKRALFFFFASLFIMLSIFIFKYSGAWWHYLFFYVYFIVSVWILRLETGKPIKNPIFIGVCALFCITTIFFNKAFVSEVYSSNTGKIAKIIKENKLFEGNKKIFALDSFSQTSNGILPYFPNIKFYNVFGDKKYSFMEYKHYMYKDKRSALVDSLALSIDDTKENIGISDRKMYPIYRGEIYSVILNPVFYGKNFILYSLMRVKNAR